MAQWLKAHTALAEKPSPVPWTQVGQLITTYYSISRDSDALFWPPVGIKHARGAHTYMKANTLIHIK